MNPRVLPQEAWKLVHQLSGAALLEPWTLAGGTGLALQLGHRISIDLDFFIEDPFDAAALRRSLADLGSLEIQHQDEDTLHVRLSGIRLSYLRSEAPFLHPPIEYRGLRLADPRDIAAMKIIAIAGRGSRKDFVDLYAYLEAGGDFPGLVEIVRRRHANVSFNEVHLLRSLVYFEDAEEEPMPRMLHKVDWPEIRARLEEEVRRWAP
jgi:Nucleotidyl transferase AbiEii toxin, Type IV TA system